MGGMAKPLTTAEMHDVAAYYESLPGQLVYKK
jgi:cytochrome c553